MQLSLFELKLKTFPLLHHRDRFVFTRKFLKQLPYVNAISQIARWIWRYFETYNQGLENSFGTYFHLIVSEMAISVFTTYFAALLVLTPIWCIFWYFSEIVQPLKAIPIHWHQRLMRPLYLAMRNGHFRHMVTSSPISDRASQELIKELTFATVTKLFDFFVALCTPEIHNSNTKFE